MTVQSALAPRMFLTLDNLSTTSWTSMCPVLLQVIVLRPKYVADCDLCHSQRPENGVPYSNAHYSPNKQAQRPNCMVTTDMIAPKMTCCGADLTRAASMGCGPTTATRALTTTRTTAAIKRLTSTPLLPKHSGGCTMTGPAALGVRGSLLQNLHRLPQMQPRRNSLDLGIKYLPR